MATRFTVQQLRQAWAIMDAITGRPALVVCDRDDAYWLVADLEMGELIDTDILCALSDR